MEELIKSLLNDDVLSDKTKLEMIKNYEMKWFELMCTTNQSKEELMDHNDSLLIIQKAITELEGKVVV